MINADWNIVLTLGLLLVGVIRYPDLRDELFEPQLGSLVCAADLALPVPAPLFPDDPLESARDRFRRGQDDCMPVVSRQEPHELVGLIKRRYLFRLLVERDPADDRR